MISTVSPPECNIVYLSSKYTILQLSLTVNTCSFIFYPSNFPRSSTRLRIPHLVCSLHAASITCFFSCSVILAKLDIAYSFSANANPNPIGISSLIFYPPMICSFYFSLQTLFSMGRMPFLYSPSADFTSFLLRHIYNKNLIFYWRTHYGS